MPKLSIIVATYKMQREAPRVIRSFLPPLQECVDGIDYEIIVIDNGSPEQLNIDDVIASASRSVNFVRIEPENALASPVDCINRAVQDVATGDWLMICIDGARLASSHLVRRTVDVLSRHSDAFTYVASRHLGPKFQKQSIDEGYNQSVEDGLLEASKWTENLDNLYNISVLAGAHNKSNSLLQNESNAFAMKRDTWELLGGYDERFMRPGGGLCNLELFSRYVTRRDGLNVLLYGETTFHQVHNVPLKSANYFAESIAEYTNVTGEEMYCSPSFSFLSDLGEKYDRMRAVGKFLV